MVFKVISHVYLVDFAFLNMGRKRDAPSVMMALRRYLPWMYQPLESASLRRKTSHLLFAGRSRIVRVIFQPFVCLSTKLRLTREHRIGNIAARLC